MDYYGLIGPFARLLPAEVAHKAALSALKCGLVPTAPSFNHPALVSQCFGLTFKNPVGLSAGLDNNAEALQTLLKQGFGFIEVGGVTPLPQPGNPSPRIFRLAEDGAIINRAGFPNKGVHFLVENLKRRKAEGIVGVNIAKNKDSLDHTYDYLVCLEAVYDHVDYVTVNISSPNTVGLRDLQQKEALSALMKAITEKRDTLVKAGAKRKPILYKIAPDLAPQDKEEIVEAALKHLVDGLTVTNTTITRPCGLQSRHHSERGGLSGQPLKPLALETLREIYRLSQGRIPLIGVGGIASAEDAYARIKAGASLLQLYTGLIYHGFGLVRQINEGLVRLLEQDGFKNVKEAVGKE